MATSSKRLRMDESVMDLDVDTQGTDNSGGDIFGPDEPQPPSSHGQGQASNNSDEDMVTLTAYEVLTRVEKAWQNEKLCMELLVPLVEETDCMQEQLRILEKNFPILSKRDLRLPVHQMEGERVRYLLGSYFRTRLNKIQTFPWFIQDQENARPPGKKSRLTLEEKKFLKEYLENMESHLTLIAASRMPISSQKIPTNLVQFQPNLDSYVFFNCHQDQDIIIRDADGEEEDVSLSTNSRYVMRYRPVSHLLHAEKIDLT